MKNEGYSKAEIQEKIERKREKHGRRTYKEKTMSESEIKKKQLEDARQKDFEEFINSMETRWKVIKSTAL
jgi:hypothetical protein